MESVGRTPANSGTQRLRSSFQPSLRLANKNENRTSIFFQEARISLALGLSTFIALHRAHEDEEGNGPWTH